jgi:branched-subunit amino acid aminotransferase/4-amino-4-deoxychorismate lyase
MRSVVLDCATELGLPIAEARMEVEALFGAEEIFLTNALTGVRPVASIEGRMLAGRRMAHELAQALRKRGVTESAA